MLCVSLKPSGLLPLLLCGTNLLPCAPDFVLLPRGGERRHAPLLERDGAREAGGREQGQQVDDEPDAHAS